eukprot:CAMPEP_0115592858 /NCGR_PEP_ID=MMETSP0272-20121206/10999_1 /TAXON_ID=71861 /ORGANISM="Scrippsiella trochoidea, Strain CCMP3099" /LENGTH=50 /DNA_ID=CAMNT_0003028103 /DNA_START=151 /DNA_END=303 /DNA_ORIENTATION=-
MEPMVGRTEDLGGGRDANAPKACDCEGFLHRASKAGMQPEASINMWTMYR